MASISLRLYPRSNKEDLYPIVIYIIHQRKELFISIPVDPVKKEHFIILDNGIGEISKKATYYNNRAWTNKFILAEKQRIEEIVNKLNENHVLENLTRKQLSLHIKKTTKHTNISFYDFAKEIVEEKREQNKENTARGFQRMISSFSSFKNDLQFIEIDYSFLKQYETDCFKKDLKPNTVASYLRYFRATYNRAIRQNIIESKNPFAYFSIKTEKTRKRALTRNEIKQIESYIPANKTEDLSKDIFLFSFYNAGINLNDIARLEKSNIINGRVMYARGKTKDLFNFKIGVESLRIIEKYNNKSKYLFPIILQTELTGSRLTSHILNRESQINKHMKKIGKNIDLPYPLTSYVARHSFATIAKNKNIPIHAIKEMFGHEDIRTTQIYWDSLEDSTKDDYIKEIIE